MPGRGLLVAAAVLQLVGAGLFFADAVVQLLLGATVAPAAKVFYVVGGVGGAVAGTYVAASIALLRNRRWGWWASLVLDLVALAAFASLLFAGGVGFGELLILFPMIGAPLVVTIGLLVGGRRAVLEPAPKTAADPT